VIGHTMQQINTTVSSTSALKLAVAAQAMRDFGEAAGTAYPQNRRHPILTPSQKKARRHKAKASRKASRSHR
jgi:hypothetical protein